MTIKYKISIGYLMWYLEETNAVSFPQECVLNIVFPSLSMFVWYIHRPYAKYMFWVMLLNSESCKNETKETHVKE